MDILLVYRKLKREGPAWLEKKKNRPNSQSSVEGGIKIRKVTNTESPSNPAPNHSPKPAPNPAPLRLTI